MQSSRLMIAAMHRSVAAMLIWNRCVKASNALLSPLLAVVALVRGKVTRSDVLALVSLLRSIYRLGRAQGVRGLAQYLKACSMYLMKYLAGDPLLDRIAFGPCVSLTHGGVPRIIPPMWRGLLLGGESVLIVRILLSVFGLYRVLGYKGTFSVKTITSPWTGFLPSDLIAFVPRFVAGFLRVSLEGLTWWPVPLLSKGAHSHNSASGSAATELLFPKGGQGPAAQGQLFSALVSIYRSPSFASLKLVAELLHLDWVTGQMGLLMLSLSDLFVGDHRERPGGTGPVAAEDAIGRHPVGRLATKDEPGKVRVFAMVDAFTQWMLYPVHKALMGWLRTLPQDATFDQRAGVESAMREIGRRPCWSFDLSAATDRLPLCLQVMILNNLLATFGTVWGRLLTDRPYAVPREAYAGRGASVHYAVGQPMGAYSSWAMLAVTHHLIVQFAAWRAVGGGALSWFTEYRVLGDDIIIWDKDVARHYLLVMQQLGVAINSHKSLVSTNGSFEFAKRFVLSGQDCTPVPLAAISAVGQSLDVLGQILGMFASTRLAVALRLLGFGYRSRGSSFRHSRYLTRGAYARFFLLQPGMCRDSLASWGNWFQFSLPNMSIFDILVALGEFSSSLMPRNPTEVPFFFIEAYGSELADGWTEEATMMATDGLSHSGFAFRSAVEASLAALFHGYYSTMFVRERGRYREAEDAFNSRQYPCSSEGIDQVVSWLQSLEPTSDLISTGNVQSPSWRRFVDPSAGVRTKIVRWIKFRLSLGNLRSRK